MPQLDKSVFLSESIVVLLVLVFFYVLLSLLVLPIIFRNLYIKNCLSNVYILRFNHIRGFFESKTDILHRVISTNFLSCIVLSFLRLSMGLTTFIDNKTIITRLPLFFNMCYLYKYVSMFIYVNKNHE